MNTLRIAIALLIACSIGLSPANGATPAPADTHQLLSEANAKFREAIASKDKSAAASLYAEAIARWRALIDEHGIRNATLYANLGNAYLLSGDLGRAVASYRRGERLDAGNPEIAAGLEAARRQSGSAPVVPASWPEKLLAWNGYLPHRALLIAAALAWLGGWGVILARLGGLGAPRSLAGVLLGAGVLLAAPLVVPSLASSWVRSGVIVTPGAPAYNGPSDAVYQPSFKEGLPAGTEVRMLETRAGWTHVRLGDGRDTWVVESSLEPI